MIFFSTISFLMIIQLFTSWKTIGAHFTKVWTILKAYVRLLVFNQVLLTSEFLRKVVVQKDWSIVQVWPLSEASPFYFCHSPTSTQKRSWCDHIMQWNPLHHPTETFKALPGNPGSWFSVCNLILTQLDEIWKTTSIFLKMEDDLIFF